MLIHVTLSANLRDYSQDYDPGAGLLLEFPTPLTVADIIGRLNIPLKAVKIIMINGHKAEMTSLLGDNDHVALFPALAGG
jgi:molybdopterin converting factor small subunit